MHHDVSNQGTREGISACAYLLQDGLGYSAYECKHLALKSIVLQQFRLFDPIIISAKMVAPMGRRDSRRRRTSPVYWRQQDYRHHKL
jgi:hypothetical protein